MKAALIGYGRWGKILEPYIRKYFDLTYIASRDYIIPDEVEVVFIATSINNHYDLIIESLDKRMHVFVEKPMCIKAKDCNYAIEHALLKNLVLYTDYLEMISPSRLKMVELLPEIGEIQHIHSYFGKHDDVDDIEWKLLPHQLSILSLFVDISKIKFTMKKMGRWLELSAENIELISDLNAPFKERSFTISGKAGTLAYDSDIGVVFNNEIITFDESNNIDYSIQEFIKVINGKPSNTRTALEITRIIENASTLDNA